MYRETIWKLRERSGKSVKLAVISVLHNEKLLLPQFLRYYSPQVDAIFLYDNESDDGCMDAAQGIPNVFIDRRESAGLFDEHVRYKTHLTKKAECRGEFDYVMMVDCDEFVVPKRHATIKEALSESPLYDIHGTHGFNMFKGPSEGPYDPNVSLLTQRRWGYWEYWYSKPIVVRPEFKADWRPGFHWIEEPSIPRLKDPSQARFWILHYNGVEEDEFVRRGMIRTRRRPKAIAEKWGIRWYSRRYIDRTEESLRKEFREKAASTGMKIVVPDEAPILKSSS